MNNLFLQENKQFESKAAFDVNHQELLWFALKQMGEALYLTDDEGRFFEVNDEACRSLGYSREELLCMSVADIDPDFSPALWAENTDNLRGSGFYVIETRLQRKDGRIFPVEVNASLLKYTDGREYRLVIVRDILERRLTEEKLAKTRLFHRKILDSVADPLVVKDSNHRYVLLNDAFCNFMKRDRNELLNKTDRDLFPCQEAEMFWKMDEVVLNQGVEHVKEETITNPDGGVHTFVAKKTLYTDEQGDRYIVCILRDITEQKNAEEKLNEKRNCLTSMAIELSLAEERERIRIASELHDQIGQTLILARIKLAMLEFMQPSGEFDLTREMVCDLLDKVIQGVRSMTVQISPPLLVAAGLEAALECLTRQIQTDYGLRVEFKDDLIEKPLTEELRFVVFQIARELLINVVKHANTDFATLSVRRDGDVLLLEVEDYGRGFNIDENISNVSASCSFGLFNIQQRLEYLGGSMTVISFTDKGSVVSIRMPLNLPLFGDS